MTVRTDVKDLKKRIELLQDERNNDDWIHLLFQDDPDPEGDLDNMLMYILPMNRPKGYVGEPREGIFEEYDFSGNLLV